MTSKENTFEIVSMGEVVAYPKDLDPKTRKFIDDVVGTINGEGIRKAVKPEIIEELAASIKGKLAGLNGINRVGIDSLESPNVPHGPGGSMART